MSTCRGSGRSSIIFNKIVMQYGNQEMTYMNITNTMVNVKRISARFRFSILVLEEPDWLPSEVLVGMRDMPGMSRYETIDFKERDKPLLKCFLANLNSLLLVSTSSSSTGLLMPPTDSWKMLSAERISYSSLLCFKSTFMTFKFKTFGFFEISLTGSSFLSSVAVSASESGVRVPRVKLFDRTEMNSSTDSGVSSFNESMQYVFDLTCSESLIYRFSALTSIGVFPPSSRSSYMEVRPFEHWLNKFPLLFWTRLFDGLDGISSLSMKYFCVPCCPRVDKGSSVSKSWSLFDKEAKFGHVKLTFSCLFSRHPNWVPLMEPFLVKNFIFSPFSEPAETVLRVRHADDGFLDHADVDLTLSRSVVFTHWLEFHFLREDILGFSHRGEFIMAHFSFVETFRLLRVYVL